MSRAALPVLAVLLGLALASPALAEEIIYFTNGQSMPIRGHTIKDGMVQVDLGGNGFLAFPQHLVEKIERAGSNVVLEQSGAAERNRMFQGVEDSSTSAPVYARRPAQPSDEWQQQQAQQQPELVKDEHGLSAVKPFGGSANPAKQRLMAVGNQAVLNGPANDNRINRVNPRGLRRTPLSSLALNPGKQPNSEGGTPPSDAPPPEAEQEQPEQNEE
jgi:hypothetical protein